MKVRVDKIVIVLLLILMCQVSTYAQDDVQFTFFPWATSYYNAGGIGEQNNTLCFTAIYQNKYMGWNDVYYDKESGKKNMDKTAPQDFLFNMESYQRVLRGSVGLSVISDRIGFYNNTGVKLGYSYKLRIGLGHLGIGAQIAMYNQKIKAKWRPIDEGDEILTQLKEGSNLDLDFNLGVLYKSDRWYAGISMTQLASAFDKKHVLRLSGEKHISRTPHLYFHGGYDWIIPSNPNWELIPHALIKTDLKVMQLDLMLLTRYNGFWWGGIDYRIHDAVSLLFGARPFYNSSNVYLKGMDVGVSYSFTTNKLAYRTHRSAGDIEVMVRYCFDIYKEEVFFGYGSTRSIYKNEY